MRTGNVKLTGLTVAVGTARAGAGPGEVRGTD